MFEELRHLELPSYQEMDKASLWYFLFLVGSLKVPVQGCSVVSMGMLPFTGEAWLQAVRS